MPEVGRAVGPQGVGPVPVVGSGGAAFVEASGTSAGGGAVSVYGEATGGDGGYSHNAHVGRPGLSVCASRTRCGERRAVTCGSSRSLAGEVVTTAKESEATRRACSSTRGSSRLIDLSAQAFGGGGSEAAGDALAQSTADNSSGFAISEARATAWPGWTREGDGVATAWRRRLASGPALARGPRDLSVTSTSRARSLDGNRVETETSATGSSRDRGHTLESRSTASPSGYTAEALATAPARLRGRGGRTGGQPERHRRGGGSPGGWTQLLRLLVHAAGRTIRPS